MARLETEGSGPSLSRMSSFGPQGSAPSMSAGGRVGAFVPCRDMSCRAMRFLLVVGHATQGGRGHATQVEQHRFFMQPTPPYTLP